MDAQHLTVTPMTSHNAQAGAPAVKSRAASIEAPAPIMQSPAYIENAPAPITLLPKDLAVLREGRVIALRRREFTLLEFLIRNRRRAINRHTLLEYVWNSSSMAMTNTLAVHIASLRRKLDANFYPKILRTIGGGYYMLN